MRFRPVFTALLLLSCLTVGVSSTPAATPPNIVFILTDDLGWSDLGCYGSAWQNTPNLDKLAGQGMHLTDMMV